MTKRTAAGVLALLPLTVALGACQSQADPTTNGGTTAAPATTAAAADSNCTPLYPDMNNTGVTLSGGTVTGEMTLSCDQDPTGYFGVSIALFYRPNTDVSTTYLAGPNYSTYQDTYTVTATCKPGLWYLGAAINGTPVKGTVVDITDCTQSID